MFTSIDCKSYLVKELATRNVPWSTSDRQWQKITQYKDGNDIIREFQHLETNIVLSIRDNGQNLNLEFNRSEAYFKNWSSIFNRDSLAENFFVAVCPRGSDCLVTVVHKQFFYDHNDFNDGGESVGILEEQMRHLFADCIINPVFNANIFELFDIPPQEVWRRLSGVGFTPNSTLDHMISEAVPPSYHDGSDFDIAIRLSDAIDRLGSVQQSNKSITSTLSGPTNPVTPSPRNGPLSARKVAPPTLRRFGQVAVSMAHSSVRQDEPISTLDTAMFVGDSWPPSTPKGWSEATMVLLHKKEMDARDINRLKTALEKLTPQDFTQWNILGRALLHENNALVLNMLDFEEQRRITLGQNVKPPTADDTESFALDIL